jgi:hypothetical protein
MTLFGSCQITFQFVNYYHNQTLPIILSNNLYITDKLFTNPIVNIKNRASLFYQPNQQLRLQQFITTGYIVSTITESYTQMWTINSIDKSTGQLILSYNQTGINPTVNFADFVISSNTLAYGLYEFIYQVIIDSNPYCKAQINTFIEIIPSGINVFSLSNQAIDLTIGLAQSIDLLPSIYSIDLDQIITANQLDYKFYCQCFEFGLGLGYPQSYANQYDDLNMFKMGLSSVTMSNTATCFNSSGK